MTRETKDDKDVEIQENAAAKGARDVRRDLTYDEAKEIAREEGMRPAFYAKVNVLNDAIFEIGMGRYQLELFITAGFGWMADNLWLQAIAIVMPAVANEWVGYPHIRLATLALYVGLIFGATFWGMSCDVIGRRLAWNSTLLVSGIFGVAVGAAPNYVAFASLIACVGFGAGGNLPVDGTMFLEFIPGPHQYLLTFLSVWWAIGQVIGSLISWVFLAHYGCPTPPAGEFCSRESNMGWRYAYFCMGALMIFLWAIRFFVLPVYESPKFLASVGRDEEAVAVIHKIAKRNGTTSSLTIEHLRDAALPFLSDETDLSITTKFSTLELVKHSFDNMSADHITALFSTRRLALSTSLVIFCYASLGLGYPLFNAFLGTFLAEKNANLGNASLNATYSAYTYQAACGVPGSILAALLVNWSRGGRKFAMSFFTIMAGAFLFALIASKTTTQTNALVSVASFWENAFYGVLYGYAPEVFPTPSRGTGDALASAASRFTGLFAPIIAAYIPDSVNGPVYASASIFMLTGIVMLFLPIETVGKTAL
ncbi:MFS general substrate transporter [Kockovaella imperatae]|uniref:MFS general substrate transporter n=1 Tax=Kockovaella imperatae TaxID=4999 RepID=A0A1Y1UKL3_9TREE|nr:MFS general substrate transporter [Kockovaella imperatae]ORX38077.1 MFS general substrate transporter [Kockovaella imperatae]